MWWKMAALVIATMGLAFSVTPIRTQPVSIDSASTPPPANWSLSAMLSNMYLTPGTVMLLGVIMALASYIAFRISRSGKR